jgi:hemerythrin-like domain-containing protein
MSTPFDPLINGIRGVHRALTRALTVMQEASGRWGEQPDVDRKTTEGFRLYAHTFCDLLHAHHDGEEEIGFPRLRANLPAEAIATLARQHQEMLQAHHAIQTLVAAPVPWPRETWQGLHQATASLLPGWLAHRDEEERLIALAAQVLSVAERRTLAKELEAHGMAHAGPAPLVVPFLIYNLAGRDREELCALFPFLLKGILVPYLWRGRYKPMLPFLHPR